MSFGQVCKRPRHGIAETLLADSEARTAAAETARAIAELADLTQRIAIAETQLVTERERAERATADFTALVQRLSDIAAENARAAQAAQRSKPWWRRWRRAS
jgi:hypothetical protein